MYRFEDPSGRTRAAVIAVWVYLAAETLFGLTSLYAIFAAPLYGDETGLLLVSGLAGIGLFVALIVSVVLVARWIYLVTANAHVLSEEMTITPGWSVGWYFVPIANLFKPFQAMKETWMASHYRGGRYSEPTPSLLGWWWGLWLATNLLSNVAMQLEMRSDGAIPSGVFVLDVVVAVLNVPLCLVLIEMMRRLCRVQLQAIHDETFA